MEDNDVGKIVKQTNTGLWLALLALALSPLACGFNPYPDLEGFEACADGGGCALDTCSCLDQWGVCAPNDAKDPPESCHPVESVCVEDSDCLLVMPGACPHHCIDGQCLSPDWVVNEQTYPSDDPDLRLYFTFDHDDAVGAANGVKDESGKGNHGTLSSGTYLPRVDGQAVSLDGIMGILLPSSPSLEYFDGLSLEAWINPRSLPESGRMGIIDKNNQYGLFIYWDVGIRCTAGGAILLGGGLPPIDAWTHVVCTADPFENTASLYVDGELKDSQIIENMLLGTSKEPVAVGADSPAGDACFDGALDNVRIWNRALNAADICWIAE